MPFCSKYQLTRIEGLLLALVRNQETINRKLERFMATTPVTLEQLTTDVNALQTALTTGLTDLQAEIANLKAANPGTDFSALDKIINDMTAQVKAADPGAQTSPPASGSSTPPAA